MRRYLARRAVFAVGTLFGVSVIIFVVLRILPGDPLVAILGVEGHAKMTPADRVRIMHDLGLSDPLPVQYVHWLRDIVARISLSEDQHVQNREAKIWNSFEQLPGFA